MRPGWVLFDLNGTLLDPGGVGEPLGLSREGSLAALDDAIFGSMAETFSGSYRPLPHFLRAALVLRAGTESGIEDAMERARAMPAYPDCTPALEQLGSAGVTTGVLTNSARETAEAALGAPACSTASTW
jgi:FMN phosphatase YigB (HAD superfamily)